MAGGHAQGRSRLRERDRPDQLRRARAGNLGDGKLPGAVGHGQRDDHPFAVLADHHAERLAGEMEEGRHRSGRRSGRWRNSHEVPERFPRDATTVTWACRRIRNGQFEEG